MSQVVHEFAISMEQVDGYEFRVRFDKEQFEELSLDEPAPLGRDSAPNATRVLAAAVGNCLAASLVFCLKKSGHTLEGIRSDVRVSIVRTEQKRLRIGAIDVTLHPRIAADSEALARCLGSFEDFCVVTQSVRAGLDVRVHVEPEPAQ